MEHDNDIFWRALNYRTAATPHAEQMWQELDACVKRLIAEEREECAKMCEEYIHKTGDMIARGCLASMAYDIRERANVKVRG